MRNSAILLLTSILLAVPGWGQPGKIDPSFSLSPAPNGVVRDLLVLEDGSFVVGGEFSAPRPFLAKYDSAGNHDASFEPVLDGAVHTLSRFSRGIVLGGAFTMLDDTTVGGITTLRLDGSTEEIERTGVGFNGPVNAIYVRGSQWFVGGEFTSYQGNPAFNMVELRVDGRLTTDFRVDGPVFAVSRWFGGAVACGGDFANVGGLRLRNFAVLDRFGSSSGGVGVNVNVKVLTFHQRTSAPTEIAAIGGDFTNLNGAADGFAVLTESSGALRRMSLTGAALPTKVTAAAFDSLSGMVVAGEFGEIWRYENPSRFGFQDTYEAQQPFNVGGRALGVVHAIGQDQAGRFYVGGDFEIIDRTERSNFARLYGPHGTDLPDAVEVADFKVTDDRAWVAVERADYALEYLVEHREVGGHEWHPAFQSEDPSGFLLGLRPESSYEVRAKVRNSNGMGPPGGAQTIVTSSVRHAGTLLYHSVPSDWVNVFLLDYLVLDASGRLGVLGPNDIEGALTGGFVVLDTQLQLEFSLNDTNNPRAELAAYDPATGGFVLEAPTGSFIRIDGSGQPDPAFAPAQDFSWRPRVLAAQADGRVLIGGELRETAGDLNDVLVRLNADGSVDSSYDPAFQDGPGIGLVDTLEVLPGDRLLLAGDFDHIDGIFRGQVAILTATGEVDPSFVPDPVTDIWDIEDAAMDSQGRVYLSGREGVRRLLANGAIDPSWTTLQARSGFGDRDIEVIELQPDGKLLAAGSFDNIDGHPACGLVRFNTDGTIDPTFDAGLGFWGEGGFPSIMLDIKVLPDSTIAVLGIFDHADGQERESLVLLRGEGSPSDWSRWLESHGLPVGSDPGSDGDGDGLCLGLEFAYERDPSVRDGLDALQVGDRIARIRPPLQRGVIVEGEFSEDLGLGQWESVPVNGDWTMVPPANRGDEEGFFRFLLRPGM